MDSGLVAVLTGSGGACAVLGAIVICILTGLLYPKSVVTDLKEELAETKAALETERDRANTAVAASSATRDVMAALQTGLSLGKAQADHDPAHAPEGSAGAGVT